MHIPVLLGPTFITTTHLDGSRDVQTDLLPLGLTGLEVCPVGTVELRLRFGRTVDQIVSPCRTKRLARLGASASSYCVALSRRPSLTDEISI